MRGRGAIWQDCTRRYGTSAPARSLASAPQLRPPAFPLPSRSRAFRVVSWRILAPGWGQPKSSSTIGVLSNDVLLSFDYGRPDVGRAQGGSNPFRRGSRVDVGAATSQEVM